MCYFYIALVFVKVHSDYSKKHLQLVITLHQDINYKIQYIYIPRPYQISKIVLNGGSYLKNDLITIK